MADRKGAKIAKLDEQMWKVNEMALKREEWKEIIRRLLPEDEVQPEKAQDVDGDVVSVVANGCVTGDDIECIDTSSPLPRANTRPRLESSSGKMLDQLDFQADLQ
jgi:hypothetical protein